MGGWMVRRTGRWVPAWAAGASLLALAAAMPAMAQDAAGRPMQVAQTAAATFRFAIPAKPLPQAIADLSALTGVQVLYTAERPFSVTAQPVQGTGAPHRRTSGQADFPGVAGRGQRRTGFAARCGARRSGRVERRRTDRGDVLSVA